MPPYRVVLLLIASCVAASAGDSFGDVSWTFTPTSDTGTNDVLKMTGESMIGVFQLIMGPGYWIVMGIGGISMLIGWFKGNKETIFMGLGLFIFAALIRGAIRTIIG